MLLNYKTGEDLCEREGNRYSQTNIPQHLLYLEEEEIMIMLDKHPCENDFN